MDIVSATGLLKKLIGDGPVSEIRLLLKDQVSSWRLDNILRIIEKSRGVKTLDENGNLKLNPKCIISIIEEGSLEENEDVQNLWAGLLASSVNDENILFINMLKSLTPFQCRILIKSVNAVKEISNRDGLLYVDEYVDITFSSGDLSTVYGDNASIMTIDRELDSLREKGLIKSGFSIFDATKANVTPMPLALHFIARCNGFFNITQFYSDKIKFHNDPKLLSDPKKTDG